MTVDQAHIREKILAASRLLAEDATTVDKAQQVKQLLQGLNPRLDRLATEAVKAISKIENIAQGDVVELSVDNLPEKTPERKKRKKYMLLFLKYRRQLQDEVARIEKELAADSGSSPTGRTAGWSRVIGWAKGPLGLITMLAAAIVWLKSVGVAINITNQGCRVIQPAVDFPVNLPGLKLPSGDIGPGETAEAIVPGVKLKVTALPTGQVVLEGFRLKIRLNISQGTDVVFDGQNLLGQTTEIDLGAQKTHSLLIRCR